MRTSAANLHGANRRRSETANAINIRVVRQALDRLGDHAPPTWAEAGRLRLQHPTATLRELGELAQPAMTKDTIARRLARLIDAYRRTLVR